MDTIENRVARLERTARRWKSAAIVLAIIGAAAFTAAAQKGEKPPEEILAKSFAVLNANGEHAIILDTEDDGSGTVTVFGP